MKETIPPNELQVLRHYMDQAELAQLRARNAHLELLMRHGLGPKDVIDVTTGAVTRHEEPEPAPELDS